MIASDCQIKKSIEEMLTRTADSDKEVDTFLNKIANKTISEITPFDSKFQYKIMRRTILQDKLHTNSLYSKLKTLSQEKLKKLYENLKNC